MRRTGSIILVITLIISFASTVYAQTPVAKLSRGAINVLTGITELPLNVIRTCKSEGAATGLTIGLGRGLAMAAYRTLVGIYEVVTFPIAAPAGYKAITDPPTLMTSETISSADPALRSDFRPLSAEYEKKTRRK